MKQVKIYKCNICGNIVLKLEDKSETLACCNQPMVLLAANTTDAAIEKHVPVLAEKIKECQVANAPIYKVQVGSIPHPMLPEHYINWIGSFTNNAWVIKWLEPGNKPEHKLKVDSDANLYEYCNIHGLWKK
ncbi:MAG: desulfoferrodoxin FeS4 iron-binding domain-containing protein [Mycoplasmataceae bacterium]|jgi:superoxide reductase|nr:desulfoferrodoxin FeS4 iron-binding domain-containing protein [Mycoplasmataceae bacterium]